MESHRDYPLLVSEDKWCLDGGFDKNAIKEIIVADSLRQLKETGSEKSWDVSEKQDGGITAYLLCGGTKIIIAGNGTGRICANASMKKMFAGFTALERIGGLGEILDTRNVRDMSYLFYHCISLRELDLSKWDVSSVTKFRGTFCCGYNQIGNARLKKLNLSGWNVSKAMDMAYMFYGCGNLREVDVKDWDVSNVTNFRHTFADCFRMREIDVSRWNTHSVITVDGIFNDCRRLKEIDISSWDTASCREFDQMFDNCSALRRIKGLSQINTGSGISFEEMFFGCGKLCRLDLSSVNTDHVDGSEFTAYASSIKSKSTIKNMLVGCNGLREITISPSLLQSVCQTRENVLLDKLNEVGYIVVSPKTGSMTPMLRPDRDQAAFYAQDTIKRGDIALFKSEHSTRLVMHRIYRALSNGYLIKGDRDRYAEFVPKENVYAAARQIYRNGKRIARNSMRYDALSVCSKVYNTLLASYRRSNHVFWKAARRVKRKLF